jgi:hypothetical protein
MPNHDAIIGKTQAFVSQAGIIPEGNKTIWSGA